MATAKPKPTPDIQLDTGGGETLNPPTPVFPMPYSVFPVVTLTPGGGSATKGIREKKKRKKKGRKKRKRKGGKRGRRKTGKGGIKWPKRGGIKWPHPGGIAWPHGGTSPFGIPGAKGRKPPKGRKKKKKKKKGRKGKKGKKGGKKGKVTPLVEFTRRGGFTANAKVRKGHPPPPPPDMSAAPTRTQPGNRFAVEGGLFRHTRQRRGKRERFRLRPQGGMRKTSKFGGKERFRSTILGYRKRQKRVK